MSEVYGFEEITKLLTPFSLLLTLYPLHLKPYLTEVITV
jgi:hypothetical protein